MYSLLNLGRFLTGFVLLSVFVGAQAVPITLDAGGTTFGAELKTGTSNIGVLFFHGRGGSNDGNFVRQVGTALNGQGYTTLSLDNPTAPGGSTAWLDYVVNEDTIDDQVFAYIDAALVEIANRGVEHIVLAGLSLGSRFMTAAAAAWDLGIYNPSVNMNLVGLIGASMYPDTGEPLIARTAANPTSIGDFNVLDVESNLAFIDSLPVMDLYGNKDSKAVNFADARRNAYGGDPGQYVQSAIDCPAVDGSYYAWLGGNTYVTYDENRCHQLRDGYLPDGNGGYYKAFNVRGPMINEISAFMGSHVIPATQVSEPSGLLLMFLGLPILLVSRKKLIK